MKLFADDSTFYHVGDELHNFDQRLAALFEWCAVNRLDINWKKTYAMFIINKRMTLPTTVTINGISVDVVTNFKLLGVTIDNKLSFSSYVSSICRIVNTKLFSKDYFIYLLVSNFNFSRALLCLILIIVLLFMCIFRKPKFRD